MFLAPLWFVACDRQPPGIGDDDGVTPFSLVLHERFPNGDYQAVTGIRGTNSQTAIGDSVFQTLIWQGGAQFRASDGNAVPWGVALNSAELAPTGDPSLLRLSATSDTSIRGSRVTWRLLNSADTVATVSLDPVPLLDSIAPFPSLLLNEGVVRSDTSFTFTWGGASNAMILEWRAPGDTLVEELADFPGRYTLSSPKLATLRGPGTVILTRFSRVTTPVEGKNVVFIRLSQRVFEGIYVQ